MNSTISIRTKVTI